jgi:hypothetical protein
MGRIWALVGALVVVYLILSLAGPFLGAQGLLTMGLTVGAGVAAAYLAGPADLWRGVWVFFGVLIGALGFAIGASLYPDTGVGLFLGAVVPTLITAVATMWQKRMDYFVAALIGSGALAGVYSTAFDTDPQSLNVSLPIAVGQTLLPLGFGYLAAVLIRAFLPDPKDTAMEPSTLAAPVIDDATRRIDVEANR